MSDERSATAIDVKVGQRVRSRRLEIGMSQEKLAELLGVTFQQVQKYEKGVNRIAVSRLWDIAEALEWPIGKFFEGIKAKNVTPAQERRIEDALSTAEGSRLMVLFSALPSVRMRRRVLELVETLTKDYD